MLTLGILEKIKTHEILTIHFINHFFNILDNSRKVPTKTEQAVPTKRETVSAPVAKAPKQEVAADAEEMDF